MYTLNANSQGKECACYVEFIISILVCSLYTHLFGIAFIQLFGAEAKKELNGEIPEAQSLGRLGVFFYLVKKNFFLQILI